MFGGFIKCPLLLRLSSFITRLIINCYNSIDENSARATNERGSIPRRNGLCFPQKHRAPNLPEPCSRFPVRLSDREGITQIQALLSAQQPAGIKQRWVSSSRQQEDEVRMKWEGEKGPRTAPGRPGSPLLPSLTAESDPSGLPALGSPESLGTS